jgi:hypothetical protein
MKRPPAYLVIGVGRFGSRATVRLLEQDPGSRIVVVDREETALRRLPQGITSRFGDGVSLLRRSLNEEVFDWIVPAVPFHLAFEFILAELAPLGARRSMAPDLPGLPNPSRGKAGDLYTSSASFLCPDDCVEPAGYCTATGEKRTRDLYEKLKDATGSWESSVIRSHQLGPGVGGILQEDLLEALRTLSLRRPPDRPLLISTACRCHGIVSALTLRP